MSLQLYTDEVAVVNPKYKHLLAQRSIDNVPTCPFLGAIDRTNEDHWIYRKPIPRSGYWVVRYKGHYRQVLGGLRTPLFLSEIKQGKC